MRWGMPESWAGLSGSVRKIMPTRRGRPVGAAGSRDGIAGVSADMGCFVDRVGDWINPVAEFFSRR
jgi:hypothetical protein